MKRPLLKLYAFNFFQSQKKKHSPHHVFGFAFLFVFYFYFRARIPPFLVARVNLPIESKVWSRVARTNYRWTKHGYWTIPVVDPGEGPGGPGPVPTPHPLFLTKLRHEGPKNFLRPAPPPRPLSEGLDSP